MKIEFIQSIETIGHSHWNRLTGVDYPFLRYEFLHTLEQTGACNKDSGWQPYHAIISYCDDTQASTIIACMPLYLKSHSYGEYIFDWAWAEAYYHHHLDYYPKMLAAIPFTPATGPRLSIDTKKLPAHIAIDDVYTFCFGALIAEAKRLSLSSAHILFTDSTANQSLSKIDCLRFIQRDSFQYHWFNRQYFSFEDFLAQLKSRKRKAIKKERLSVQQQDISISRLTGHDLTPELWDQFYAFYQNTYAKRSGHGGYLSKGFFQLIGQQLASQIMLVIAKSQDNIIAAALNFYSSTTLYGRYWGCNQDAEFLHFELCYYQGIEFCIEQGLQTFDAGAQGEHKVQRGFEPVITRSHHWIAHAQFNAAIKQFIKEEERQINKHTTSLKAELPFKKTV